MITDIWKNKVLLKLAKCDARKVFRVSFKFTNKEEEDFITKYLCKYNYTIIWVFKNDKTIIGHRYLSLSVK